MDPHDHAHDDDHAGPTERPADPEVPEADGLEQEREVTGGTHLNRVTSDPEVAEADAIEQAMDLPGEVDEERNA
ncbi:MAG: hypothetical protein ACR2HP_01455 [Ilumatobacteraceae bacterium]